MSELLPTNQSINNVTNPTVNDGSITAPSIAFSSEAGTGFSLSNTNEVTLSIAQVNRLCVNNDKAEFNVTGISLNDAKSSDVPLPATGKKMLFSDITNGRLKFKLTNGTIVDLGLTTNIDEGTNLYFTNNRAVSAVSNGIVDKITMTGATVTTEYDYNQIVQQEPNSDFKISTVGTGRLAVSTNATYPLQNYHVATKEYVDNYAAGLKVHAEVKTKTATNLSAFYINGTGGVGATLTSSSNVAIGSISGYAMQLGDRILVDSQTTKLQNGIYTVTQLGVNSSLPWILTRATDLDGSPTYEVTNGVYVFVSAGTYIGRGYVLSTPSSGITGQNGAIVIGTDSLVWAQFAGAGTGTLTPSRIVGLDSVGLMTSINLSSYVAGTTNRITITDNGTGGITINAPQDLHTSASVTFGDITSRYNNSTLGTNNIYGGTTTGQATTTGTGNTGFGVAALVSLISTNYNSAYGHQALNAATGSYNSAFGYQACRLATVDSLSAFGYQALAANTTGTLNTAFGYQALAANTIGSSNTASGYKSLTANTTGGFNTAFGYATLAANTTLSDLTAFGANALNANTTGTYNVGVGSSALKSNTTGSFNTANGTSALFTNVAGSYNTAFGYQACRVSTVDGLSGFGYQALTANTTGTNNSGFGYQALAAVTTGGSNAAFGYQAASSVLTTGTNNAYFGASTVASGAAVTNENVFGYGTTGLGSNTITYGNSSITKHVFQAGSVGIGLTGPSVPLSVYNAATTATYDLVNFKTEYTGSSFAETRLTLAKGVYGGAISGYIINGASSGLVFYTISSGTYTENMRLSNSNLNIPTGTLSVGTTGSGPRINVLIGTSYDSTNIGRGLQICGASTTNGQYISLVQFGVASWSIGYVYGTSKFAIGAGSSTDSSFTNPVFTLSGTTLGINNPSPTYSLDVTGTGRFTSTLIQNGPIDTTAAALSAVDNIAYTFYNFKPTSALVSKNGGHGNYVMVGVSGKFVQNSFYTSDSTTHLEVDPSVDGTGTGASYYIAVSYGLRIKTGLYVNDVRTLYNLYVDAPAKGTSTASVAVAAYLANLSVGYTGVDLAGTNNVLISGNIGAGTNAPLYGIDVANSLRIRSTATFLPLSPIDLSTATPSSGDIISWSFWNLAPTTISFLTNGGNGDYNFINLSGTATQAIFYYSNSWTYLNINPIVNGGADGGTNYLKNSYSLRIRPGTYTHEVRNIYNLYVEAPAAGTTFGSPVKQAAYLENLSVGYSTIDMSGTNNIICAGKLGMGIVPTTYQLDLSLDTARKLTTTTWATGSDVRIKRNIVSLDSEISLNVIDKLNPVEYKYEEKYATEYKIDDGKYYGFIADEVEQVLDGCVTKSNNELIPISDDECKEIFGKTKHELTAEEKRSIAGYINGIKMLNPHNIQVHHLAATKQLIKENRMLKERLAKIEERLGL